MRPPRDLIFMEVAHVIRKRSTCSRGSVGAVAVLDNRIIATGYNGAPSGAPHCTALGCDVPANNHELGCQRVVHAESALIAHAARHGIKIEGATLYCTHGPCLKCAHLIVSAGFNRFVFGVHYRLPEGLNFVNLYIDGSIEQMDPEVIQVFEDRHAEAVSPTEAQEAEAEAYP